MESGGASRSLHILLAGQPGIGKTTICKKVTSMLEKKDSRLDGFYTEEVRDQSGNRIGFDVVRVKETGRLPLARLKRLTEAQRDSKYQVGNYNVFLNNFEAVALPALNSDADILFIDEIGKMELFSEGFKKKVIDIFFGPLKKARVIGTIPQVHKVPRQHATLFHKLQANDRVKILNVSRDNRNNLPTEIVHYIS